MSIITSAVTLFSGNLYLTGDLSSETKILLFIFILLANAFFILYWVYCMLENMIVNLLVKYPKLMVILCCVRKRSVKVATLMREETVISGSDTVKISQSIQNSRQRRNSMHETRSTIPNEALATFREPPFGPSSPVPVCNPDNSLASSGFESSEISYSLTEDIND